MPPCAVVEDVAVVTALVTVRLAPVAAAVAELLMPTGSCVLMILPVLVTPAPVVAVVCTSKVIVPVELGGFSAGSVPPANSVTVPPPARLAGAAVATPLTIKLLIAFAPTAAGKVSVMVIPLAASADKHTERTLKLRSGDDKAPHCSELCRVYRHERPRP